MGVDWENILTCTGVGFIISIGLVLTFVVLTIFWSIHPAIAVFVMTGTLVGFIVGVLSDN